MTPTDTPPQADQPEPGEAAMEAAGAIIRGSREAIATGLGIDFPTDPGPQELANVAQAIQRAINAAVKPVEAERDMTNQLLGELTVKRERGELDCPLCVGSGHVEDAKAVRRTWTEKAKEWERRWHELAGGEEALDIIKTGVSIISLAQERDEALAALGFASSVIKSGEPWTQECEKIIGKFLKAERWPALLAEPDLSKGEGE